MAHHPINSQSLQAFTVPKDIYNAISNAAQKTGVNFTYLMEKAAVESGFDKNAKAPTSSATGLYQFIESTWLSMVRDHGDKYGLEKYARKIDDNGNVSDSKTRKEILALRKDPEVASLMAAEFDTANYEQLKDSVGGKVGATELYMAHFMGANGASGFLNAMKKSPNMAAADLFPREARANRNVFYDSKTGQPRSLQQVYAMFDKKFDGALNTTGATAVANNNSVLNAHQDSIVKTANYKAYNGDERTAPARQQATYQEQDTDVFARLATLMDNNSRTTASLLRVSGNTASNDWQIFPPSLYNKLSLSPAQMMMLSDFKGG